MDTATTEERGLKAVVEDEPETGSTIAELDGKETPPDPGEGDPPVAPGEEGDDAPGGPDPDDDAESEEAAREQEEEEEKARRAAAKKLSGRIAGINPTVARVQITGGALEIPASIYPDKDDELEITVRGWVKTDKATTETKGASAVREAVFVVEELIAVENHGRAQMQLGDDE